MKTKSVTGWGLAALLFCTPGVGAEPAAKPAANPPKAKPKLAQPDYLPSELRGLLQRRMASHGQDLINLMLSVTLLQRDVAKAAADHIAQEPRLAKPIAGGEADLNAALPSQFFVLQDQLRLNAKAVSAAAAGGSDAALAASFSRLNETCVACHALYLRGSEKEKGATETP